MEITRTPLTRDELECCVELTLRLVELRQNECKHLCVENIGPEIFEKLTRICYGPQLVVSSDIDISFPVNGGASDN